jgi:Mn2+/Fe2+ NRAMP family transporter
MRKNTINFWVDVIIFVDSTAVIFTGILIHRFPYELKTGAILGFPRFEWGDLHWVLALFLCFLVLLHLVLHWTWAKVSFNRYLRIGPKVLAITVIIIAIFGGIVAPLYLTRDFTDRKLLRDAYRASYSLRLEKHYVIGEK